MFKTNFATSANSAVRRLLIISSRRAGCSLKIVCSVLIWPPLSWKLSSYIILSSKCTFGV
jgi:hypothetical protein